jgi:hypothetical protein
MNEIIENLLRLNIVFIYILVIFIQLISCESLTTIPETNFPGYTDTTSYAIPTNFSIDDLYPNPFEDEINIEISIPLETHITLIIQNPLGDVVKILFSQNISPRRYVFIWDGTNDDNKNVNNGKYFVTLESEKTNFVQSKIIKLQK